MKVHGIEISEGQIAAMLQAMGTRFRLADVISAAEAAGVQKGEIAMRAADRLVQKQRKAGKIRIIDSGPYWAAA